jgi:hypothetical protein
MSLSDNLANPPVLVPTKYEKRAEYDTETGKGEGATGPVRVKITDHRQLLELAGFDADNFRIVGRIAQWTKTHHDREDTYSFFFQTEMIRPDEEEAIDLPALYAEARRTPRKPIRATADSRVTVVALSDVQAGKVDHRGGTPELIDRLAGMRDRLAAHLKARKPSRTVLAEVGDLFEGFESGGNPMFTNDLSLAQQMDLAGTELYRFLEVMQRHGRVDVVAVTSNHTAWRNGKQQLGRPGDDLGLFVHKQVRKVAEAAGIDAHWTFPEMYSESVVLDVLGTHVGVVHGNQFNPGQAVTWWQKQQHGGGPTARADVLLSGHYHNLTVMPSGRNPVTGRSKWWLQCPTTDSGSSWFANAHGGSDSDPGLLVFDVTEDGFDLSSLTVL